MKTDAKVYVAGHTGMVGSAFMRNLKRKGFSYLITRSSSQLDLRDSAAVAQFFREEKPDYVLVAAAKVGGIQANNTYRAEFIYDNLMIASNVIHNAYLHGVKKLLFLGSSCLYPKFAAQPMKEEYLLTGAIEPTNEPYAIAKIAGIKMCRAYREQFGCNFIAVMPTNLYGPNDNYDLNNSHVLPALLMKFHTAKMENWPQVVVWGTGSPKREFLHVDDMVEACVFLMDDYDKPDLINIGKGEELSIKELAFMVKRIVGYEGALVFDESKPDGAPRKLLDVSKLFSMGWRPRVSLEEGIRAVYQERFGVHA